MSHERTLPISGPVNGSTSLSGILYALVKLDDQLQQPEKQATHNWLADRPPGDLALCALFLRDNAMADEARDVDRHPMTIGRVELTSQTKKRFVTIMLRVARAHEGVSRQEREFIRQFWRALQQRQHESFSVGRSESTSVSQAGQSPN